MQIAIHERKGSFSDRWISYCQEHNIPYKIVNCYDTDIIEQLEDCDGLMWHWSHGDYKAQNFARQLIYSLEKMGKKVFPSYDTCWHFDDKVGQKYLLEAIGVPLVPSYVFYDKGTALEWLEKATFPKVFKLRGGAGSQNVKLIRTKKEAESIIHKAFSKGFPLVDKNAGLKQRFWTLKRDKNIKAIKHVLKGFIRYFFPKKGLDLLPVQKGYVYFQDFISNNDFDDRIVIVGERAFALKRFVRKNDFRASGSGMFSYEKNSVDLSSVKIAFQIASKLNLQSVAFDFIYQNSLPFVVEISYAYAMGAAYDNCPGYWDEQLNWHEKPVNPQIFMIEDFITALHNES
jgi:hypothetical protein